MKRFFLLLFLIAPLFCIAQKSGNEEYCLISQKGLKIKISIVDEKTGFVQYKKSSGVINIKLFKQKEYNGGAHTISESYYREIINGKNTGVYILSYSGNQRGLSYQKNGSKTIVYFDGYASEDFKCDL